MTRLSESEKSCIRMFCMLGTSAVVGGISATQAAALSNLTGMPPSWSDTIPRMIIAMGTSSIAAVSLAEVLIDTYEKLTGN